MKQSRKCDKGETGMRRAKRDLKPSIYQMKLKRGHLKLICQYKEPEAMQHKRR